MIPQGPIRTLLYLAALALPALVALLADRWLRRAPSRRRAAGG